MHTKYSALPRILRYLNFVLSIIAHTIYFETCLSSDHEKPTTSALGRVVITSFFSTSISIYTLLEPSDVREWSIFSLSFALTCDCALLCFLVGGVVLALGTQMASPIPEAKCSMVSGLVLSSLLQSVVAIQSAAIAGAIAISIREMLGRMTGRIALDDDPEIADKSTLWIFQSPLTASKNSSAHSDQVQSSMSWENGRRPIPGTRINYADGGEAPVPKKSPRDNVIQFCILTITVLCVESSRGDTVHYTLVGSVMLCLGLWPPQMQAAYNTKRWFREVVRLLDGILAIAYWVILMNSGVAQDTPAPVGLVVICALHIWLCITEGWEPDSQLPSSEAVDTEKTIAA